MGLDSHLETTWKIGTTIHCWNWNGKVDLPALRIIFSTLKATTLPASSNITEQQKITLLWSELGGVFCENGASTYTQLSRMTSGHLFEINIVLAMYSPQTLVVNVSFYPCRSTRRLQQRKQVTSRYFSRAVNCLQWISAAYSFKASCSNMSQHHPLPFSATLQ